MLKKSLKDEKEANKVIGSSEYMDLQTAESMRVTLVPRQHEMAIFAFLGLNVLIRQENHYRKFLKHIIETKKNTALGQIKDKERKKLIASLETKCRNLGKSIEKLDKLIEEADTSKWPKALPDYVAKELVHPNPKGAELVNPNRPKVFGAVIGTRSLSQIGININLEANHTGFFSDA